MAVWLLEYDATLRPPDGQPFCVCPMAAPLATARKEPAGKAFQNAVLRQKGLLGEMPRIGHDSSSSTIHDQWGGSWAANCSFGNRLLRAIWHLASGTLHACMILTPLLALWPCSVDGAADSEAASDQGSEAGGSPMSRSTSVNDMAGDQPPPG